MSAIRVPNCATRSHRQCHGRRLGRAQPDCRRSPPFTGGTLFRALGPVAVGLASHGRMLRFKQSGVIHATAIARSSQAQTALLTQPPISKKHFAPVAPGIRIHYARCLPPPGTDEIGTCILLHGFPDYHGSWWRQMLALATAGYRVIAPDLRGYGLSSRPTGVESYSEAAVAADVAALAEHVCGTRTLSLLAGHDWGAFVAWATASRYPQLSDRLAILNVPHPVRFAEGLETFQQLRKSWYTFAFQVPLVPETLFEVFDFALLRRVLEADPDAQLNPKVIEEHVDSFASNPGAMSAAINYYRAAFRGLWPCVPRRGPFGALQGVLRASANDAASEEEDAQAAERIINMPVQVIWGKRDPYLGLELAQPPRSLVPNVRPLCILDATHWVHWDKPEEVNTQLLQFLGTGHE